jgi:hypothetical protein
MGMNVHSVPSGVQCNPCVSVKREGIHGIHATGPSTATKWTSKSDEVQPDLYIILLLIVPSYLK